MTYAELAKMISEMTSEQAGSDVTVFIRGVDEFYPLRDKNPIAFSDVDDVLDAGHPFLVV
jgi:hypothetical protein